MDLATLTNAPRSLTIGGQSFLVSALTQYEWGTFQAWIKDFVPKPAPPEGADNVMRALHRRAWPPAIGSKLWWNALDHPGCFPRFVQILLSKHLGGQGVQGVQGPGNGHGNGNGMSDEEALVLAMLAIEERQVGLLVIRAIGSDIDLDSTATSASSKDTEDDIPAPERPESDEPGTVYYNLSKIHSWNHSDIMNLTLQQIKYYCHGGKPPRWGVKTYSNSAMARAGQAYGQAKAIKVPVVEPVVEPDKSVAT